MATPDWLDRTAWPYPPQRLDLPAGVQHAVSAGAGPTVVFVHGTPTWSFEWRHALAALAPHRRVVAVDHLGFGLSERPPDADYRPEAHAARFHGVMQAVAPEGPVALVVHDFGGPMALDWALANLSRVSHLVVVNSFAWAPASDPAMRRPAALLQGALGRFAYRHLNLSLRVLLPAGYHNRALLAPVHDQYLRVFPDADSRERVLFALARSLLGSTAFFSALEQRLAQALPKLAAVPVTFVWGMRDPAFGPSALARWQRAIPHARTVPLANAGHWPHEEQPDAFCTALLEAVQ